MESYLDVQHLTKSFGEKVLFDDMSFSVSEGQKVGLVARNGTGKSTLLSILHGDEGYDAGQIVYRNDIRVGVSGADAAFQSYGHRPRRLLQPRGQSREGAAGQAGADAVAHRGPGAEGG